MVHREQSIITYKLREVTLNGKLLEKHLQDLNLYNELDLHIPISLDFYFFTEKLIKQIQETDFRKYLSAEGLEAYNILYATPEHTRIQCKLTDFHQLQQYLFFSGFGIALPIMEVVILWGLLYGEG